MKRFVITLPQRIDRMMEEMSVYSGEYSIVEAIRNIEEPYKGLSDTIKKVVSENYNEPYIHILEDDIQFTSNKSRELFESNFKKLPSDWGIYLGGSYSFKDNYKEYLPGLIKMGNFDSLHCVVFRKSVYDLILSHDHNETKHLDKFLGNASEKGKINVYLCNPMVAIQYTGYSYNARKSVDYTHRLKGLNILT